MSLNPSRSPQLNTLQFKEQMEKGKVYEAKIQQKITGCSPGSVYLNVRAGGGEFDVVVADYPVLSFVEIKFFRANLTPGRVRGTIRKFRNHCKRATEDGASWKKKWIPYVPPTDSDNGTSHKEALFKKLSLFIPESWRYRMILIVPNKSINIVLDSLNETKAFIPKTKQGQNLVLVNGIPLLAIPEKRIEDVFG